MIALLAGLAAATLVSEDAACVLAGSLAREGEISHAAAVTACAVGIYVGDAALWLAGRLGGPRLLKRWAPGRTFTSPVVDDPLALVASRFLPGTRLPLYVAAGAFGARPQSFFTWTLVAVLAWTPIIVLGSSQSLVAGALMLALTAIARRVNLRRLWWRVLARLDRWRRWEFWPSAIVYAPVTLWIVWLAIRHRGLATLSAANPGMPEGGFVGESKFDILAQLPERWTLPTARVETGPAEARAQQVETMAAARGWSFPLILKPDAGQRGVGVRRVHAASDVRSYFADQPGPVVVQPYHAGPFEAGIFYYRYPDQPQGRIFSITDKRFPRVIGDGESTLDDLIWRHPRCRLQAHVFLARHAARRRHVLADGEELVLAVAGNHAQGTMFRDGRHLLTPALEQRIDEIACSIPGFHFGRFDVRYASIDRFRRGDDLAIVELNGVTSESTNIYDPAFSLMDAWGVLCRQWTIAFEIGAMNRGRGAEPVRVTRLLRLSLQHLRTTPVLPIAS